MKENTFKALAASVGGALLGYFRIMAVPLAILGLAVGVDYISGMAKAIYLSELNSKIGHKGAIKKLCYFLVVVVAGCTDWLLIYGLGAVGIDLELTYYIGVIVTVWLIINELISILENLGAIGVPLPSFLMKIIKRLKQQVEKEDTHEDHTGNYKDNTENTDNE